MTTRRSPSSGSSTRLRSKTGTSPSLELNILPGFREGSAYIGVYWGILEYPGVTGGATVLGYWRRNPLGHSLNMQTPASCAKERMVWDASQSAYVFADREEIHPGFGIRPDRDESHYEPDEEREGGP